MHGSHAVLVGAQVATVLLYPSRDTFEFDQGHVTKNQPITMLVLLGPGIYSNNIQLFPEGEVNSGGYIPRCEASRYISTALHRP